MRTILRGRGVSPGVACAPLARLAAPLVTSAEDPVGADPAAERVRVREAFAAVAADLEARAGRVQGETAEILTTTAAMALDPSLLAAAEDLMGAGTPTGHAVTLAIEGFCEQLDVLGGYLAERVTDLRDVGHRTVAHLAGVPMPGVPAPGYPVVLAARDLAPADTASLGADVVALVTEEGGPTSHTAILARSLGLPAVVGCPDIASVAEGTTVLVDGTTGVVEPDPPDERRAVPAAMVPAADTPGATADGHRVALLSNIGTLVDAEQAAATASEGVGLFRTEFLFLDRRTRPDVAEQTRTYAAVLRAFGDRRVVVRTLDAGSDKPLPFLPLGHEENPALGMRGLRTAAVHPGVLDDQLTALAAAAEETGRAVDVMAPMVATAQEAERFAARARGHGLTRVGVMIEVPAAALRARELLEVVDFVSIGTNDLGQYTMAADRTAGALGDLLDPWQPALLDLVAMVGEAGRTTDKPVGVCGEAAADPLLAAVLVGLGVTSLSTAPASRPAAHAQLSALTAQECRVAADRARSARSADAARATVAECVHDAGEARVAGAEPTGAVGPARSARADRQGRASAEAAS
ncbi:phosphoenolpyruvate--protein phosphotransferase [Pseudonocardia sp.]|jgi:phosphotransferase system enzyme I (PtsI)|uniref:phosphoenolpyruvate--protein phosphotransferase n=1 Tax=Pseudonocardia sp. TaxID=60912 RepID=UPI0026191F95|nr:phosphoenolpyruvate--protein phosphotransferase [Pseudonocardia sp.]MCW2720438.1 phosphoenolpyruvate--protein phosphotransferase [Pseudonocardia sp.]MDT7617020.1 phosphoenolpyruvate-protein phosphotransferase system enzyme [Pseudonocardiales bacterium]